MSTVPELHVREGVEEKVDTAHSTKATRIDTLTLGGWGGRPCIQLSNHIIYFMAVSTNWKSILLVSLLIIRALLFGCIVGPLKFANHNNPA